VEGGEDDDGEPECEGYHDLGFSLARHLEGPCQRDREQTDEHVGENVEDGDDAPSIDLTRSVFASQLDSAKLGLPGQGTRQDFCWSEWCLLYSLSRRQSWTRIPI
jgi:hypothetical protein